MPPKRKSTTATDEEDEEYRKKRDRNNQAVKRSRVKSKMKTEETQVRVNELRVKNQLLEDKIDNQRKELKFLKELFLTQAQAKADKLVGVNLNELLRLSDEEGDSAEEGTSKPKKSDPSKGEGSSSGSKRSRRRSRKA